MIHGLILQIGLKNTVVDKDFLMMKMVVEETNLIVIQIIVNLLWLFLIYFYFHLFSSISRFHCGQESLPLLNFYLRPCVL